MKTIAYFCGVLDEVDGETPEEANARVKGHALDFMENDMAALWPLARNADGSFDWDVLVDETGASGADRFDAQYWRANTTPSERYVLTPAGSVAPTAVRPERLREPDAGRRLDAQRHRRRLRRGGGHIGHRGR